MHHCHRTHRAIGSISWILGLLFVAMVAGTTIFIGTQDEFVLGRVNEIHLSLDRKVCVSTFESPVVGQRLLRLDVLQCRILEHGHWLLVKGKAVSVDHWTVFNADSTRRLRAVEFTTTLVSETLGFFDALRRSYRGLDFLGDSSRRRPEALALGLSLLMAALFAIRLSGALALGVVGALCTSICLLIVELEGYALPRVPEVAALSLGFLWGLAIGIPERHPVGQASRRIAAFFVLFSVAPAFAASVGCPLHLAQGAAALLALASPRLATASVGAYFVALGFGLGTELGIG